jgi:hypothetical protein
MTPRKTPFFTRGIAVALLSCTSLTTVGLPNKADANWLTFDSSNFSEASTQTSTILSQLQELTNIRNLATQQLETLGDAGPLGDLFGGSAFSDLGSKSGFYENMESFAFDPCAINLCQVGDNPVGTTDIAEAREWAEKNFYASDPLDYETERDLREVRRRGRIYSAVNGVALATITSNDLAGAGDQADALEQIVESSSSLRGDLRANSAIALAAYKIELQQLAMLTSLLEVESMASIDSTSLYHEAGGTEFPDAFVEGDFAANDPTQRTDVTVPTKGSAGGMGMGGGLLGAISNNGGGLSGLASSLGSDSGLASVLGGGSGVNGLMSSMQSGILPSLDPSNLSLSTVLADSAGLAHSILPSDAAAEIRSGLSMVQTGLSNGGSNGRTDALLGISQTLASANGNTNLGAALNTASLAITKQDANMAINFANGALRDLENNGLTGGSSDYLRSQISAVENGTGDLRTLVLDASAILANNGSDPSPDIARILSVDPAGADDTYLKNLLAQAIDTVGYNTGSSDLEEIARAVESVNEQGVEEARRALARNQQQSRAQPEVQRNSQANEVFD